jgi:hypothetical protein
MKKLILAVTFVFLFLSCGPTEEEKYNELFDDDNPLIGTWEGGAIYADTGKQDNIVFIDDSTMYFINDTARNGVIFTYEFDQTLTYVTNSLHGYNEEPAMLIKIPIHDFHESVFEAYYLPNKKILLYDGALWKKIKK